MNCISSTEGSQFYTFMVVKRREIAAISEIMMDLGLFPDFQIIKYQFDDRDDLSRYRTPS